MLRNPPANAGNVGFLPGSRRSPRKEMATHSSILCRENPVDRGAWRATVNRVTNSLSNKTEHLSMRAEFIEMENHILFNVSSLDNVSESIFPTFCLKRF